MSKSHRDNTKARRKRGPIALEKRRKRRKPKYVKCTICGRKIRHRKTQAGLCPICVERAERRGKYVDFLMSDAFLEAVKAHE